MGPSAEKEQNTTRSRRSHLSSRDYIMGHSPAPVRDHSRPQSMDAPGGIHILYHRFAEPCHRRPTRSPERSDQWNNAWGPVGPLRGPALGRRVSQSAKHKDQGCRSILARICHSSRTAATPRLPWTTPGPHKKGASKSFADGVEDTAIKIPLLLGGQKKANEALRQALELQAGLLVARPPKRAPEHTGCTNRMKRPKTIGMLGLWGSRPLPRQLLLRKGDRTLRPDPETWRKTSERRTKTARKIRMVTG
jgi:hypothetical protein